jgi:hypothetical protein
MDTSPQQDVQALTAALVATVRQSAYDDMHFQEIAASFAKAEHEIRVLFLRYGTLDAGTIADAGGPPVEPPPEALAAS